jgi:hypothetical protein
MSIFLSVFETDPSRFFEPHPIRITDFPSYVEAFISGTLKSDKKIMVQAFFGKAILYNRHGQSAARQTFVASLELKVCDFPLKIFVKGTT